MKKILISLFIILFGFLGVASGATYSVCASGCNYANIAAVNAVNFASGDIIEFEKGETFTDADLTLAGIASPSGKTITVQAGGTGALPIIGLNSTYIRIALTGINITFKDLNIDGQDFGDDGYLGRPKLDILNPANVTLDNIEADGSVGYNTACTPDSDCNEHRGIWISGSTGTVEIKNCTIENWGGDEDIWLIPKPAYTGADRSCLSITVISSGYFSVHDNTITNCESDGIILEDIQSASTSSIYNNTIWNGGENSIDIKGSKNINVYHNIMGRDAAWVGIGGSSTGESAGLYKQGVVQVLTRPSYNSDNIAIYENVVGPSDASGIGVRALDAGRSISNITIYRNYITNTIRNLYTTQFSASISGIKFFSNILDGVKAAGSHIYDDEEDATGFSVFYNNTLYANSDQTTYGNQGYVSIIDSDASFINNIFYVNDANDYIVYVNSGSNPIIDHNVYYNANAGNDEIILDNATPYGEDDQAAWISAGHAGAIFDNPDFTDAASEQFWPAAGSPVEDVGATLNALYDDALNLATTWSPISVATSDQDLFGTGWDIGAFIYSVDEPIPAPTPTDASTDPATCPFCDGCDAVDVTFTVNCDAACYGRISTTDQTWDVMTSAKAMTNASATQVISTVEDANCDATLTRYVAVSTESGDNGAEATTIQIDIVVSAEGQGTPDVDIYSDGTGNLPISNMGSGGLTVTIY